MNYKNYLFTGLLISAFAVTADVPVGNVKSESATQKADQVVTMTEQSMEVRSVGGIEEVVVTATKKRTVAYKIRQLHLPQSLHQP